MASAPTGAVFKKMSCPLGERTVANFKKTEVIENGQDMSDRDTLEGVVITKLGLLKASSPVRRFGIIGLITFVGIMAVNAMGFIDHDTGSGLGCGANWPLCQGSLIPSFTNEAVIIEYVHRVLTLAFAVLLAMFLFTAYKRRHQSSLFRRLTLLLFSLLLIETVICTAGVLVNVPDAIMACLAPVGLVAQGTLLMVIRIFGKDSRVTTEIDRGIFARLLFFMGFLTLVYLYVGAWLSYSPRQDPVLTTIYLSSGVLLALVAVFWIGYHARIGKDRGYGLWPLVLAPFVNGFESRTVAGDLAIYLWLSWCTTWMIYYLLGRWERFDEGVGIVERWQRAPILSEPPQ